MKSKLLKIAFYATLTINIPNAVVNRSTTAFCSSYQYQPTLANGSPNPETPIQFTQRMIANFIRQTVIGYESLIKAESIRKDQIDTTTQDVSGIQ